MVKQPKDDTHDWWCHVCASGFDDRDVFIEHFKEMHF